MRKKIFIIINLFVLSFNIYSDVFECNSGITTELTSASNSMLTNGWMGWACGINGVVVKSSVNPPYAALWTNLTGHGIPTSVNLNNICAVSNQIAFVCGSQGTNTYLYKTTNGGTNFVQVFTQPNGYFNAVYMKNTLMGVLEGNPVGGRWSLWKTINGGLNWDSSGMYLPQSGTETGFSNSLCIPLKVFYTPINIDTNKIWFGTNNYRIYYSSNYGSNWITLLTPPAKNIYCIAIGTEIYSAPAPLLYAGSDTCLLKSTNFGINWTYVSLGGTGKITGIAYCCYNLFLTRGNKIFMKNNTNPESWITMYTAPSGTYTYFDNRGFGANFIDHYAVRDNGGISFIVQGEEVKKISSSIPNVYSLSQNYPNPFNPSTKIKFAISFSPLGGLNISAPGRGNGGNVKLIIYDVLGKEIAVLVNQQLKPGEYEVEWNASGYPSGIYFYKLFAENYTETKKLILVR
jgi:hypothetical protein